MTLGANTTSISRRGRLLDRILLPVENEARIRKYLPFEVRVGLRSRVSELAKLSISYRQIQTDICGSTRRRLTKGSISECARGSHNSWARTDTFPTYPSRELSYGIGLIAGDGTLTVPG